MGLKRGYGPIKATANNTVSCDPTSPSALPEDALAAWLPDASAGAASGASTASGCSQCAPRFPRCCASTAVELDGCVDKAMTLMMPQVSIIGYKTFIRSGESQGAHHGCCTIHPRLHGNRISRQFQLWKRSDAQYATAPIRYYSGRSSDAHECVADPLILTILMQHRGGPQGSKMRTLDKTLCPLVWTYWCMQEVRMERKAVSYVERHNLCTYTADHVCKMVSR